MNCPTCKTALEPVLYETVALDHCSGCGGFWLDQGELRKIINHHEETFSPEQINEAEDLLATRPPIGVPKETNPVACPHCGKDCVKQVSTGITFDACPSLRGIWVDNGEIEMLQAISEACTSVFTDEQKLHFGKRAERYNLRAPSFDLFDRLSIFCHSLILKLSPPEE